MSQQERQYRDPERLDLVSGSKMYMVVECPGQPNLIASIPKEALQEKPDEEDEWAQSGNRIHLARETGNTLNLDSEEAEIYRQGLEYEDQMVQKLLSDKALDDCEEGPREMRVWLHDPLKWPELLGSIKLDAHYYNRERGCVLILDWKSGFNPNLPPSPHSWQLRFGAVAVKQEEYTDWMKECRVGHVQARNKCTVNDYCDYSEADLDFSWQSIRFHLWQSSQPDAPLHAGPHCRWCPAKAWCVTAGGYSLIPSVMLPKTSTASVTELDREGIEERVALMHPLDLVKVWESANIIEKIVDAVKRRLKGMTPEELAAIGLELGKGRKLDPIANTPEAYFFLTEQFAAPLVLGCLSVQKTKLAELVMKEKGMNKEAAAKWIDENLDPWIARCTSEAPLKRIKASK